MDRESCRKIDHIPAMPAAHNRVQSQANTLMFNGDEDKNVKSYKIQSVKRPSYKIIYTQLKTHTVNSYSLEHLLHSINVKAFAISCFDNTPFLFHSTCFILHPKRPKELVEDFFGLVDTVRSSSSSVRVVVSGGNEVLKPLITRIIIM